MKSYLKKLLFVLILFSLAGCYTVDEDIFFQQVKLERLSPEYTFNDIYFTVEDSITLNAWYLTKDNSDAIILLLHGNTRNLYSYPWTNIINALSGLNADIFAVDYRGYGRSSGTPTFKGLVQDAGAALNYLKQHNPKKKPVIVYGLSMGSIPAATIASDSSVRGLILEGALSSTRDVIDEVKSNFWPMNLVKIKYDKNLEFDSPAEIKKVNKPVLIIYGKNDDLPELMSLKLYDAVKNNQKFYWKVEKGTHCDTYKVEPKEYIKRLNDFINVCR